MKPTVLLVDNEQSILKSISILLKDSYNIITATSGEEALQIVNQVKDIDCLVSDYDMDNGNGLFLIKNLGKRKFPFILLTGRGGKEVYKNFANEQIFHIYEKPVKMDIKNIIEAAVHKFSDDILKEKLSLLGKNTGQIIHDINNGLVLIQVSAQLGSKEKEIMLFEKHFDRILKGCEKIKNIVAKYKQFLNKDFKVSVEEKNIHDFVKEIAEDISLLSTKNNIKLTVENSVDKNFNLLIDETLIRQVLFNLYTNAVQANENKLDSEIKIVASSEGKYCKINIEDSGIMPEEVQKKLFTEGFSTKGTNGTGMGLVYCKGILSLFNGDLSYVRKPNTCFAITLKKD